MLEKFALEHHRKNFWSHLIQVIRICLKKCYIFLFKKVHLICWSVRQNVKRVIPSVVQFKNIPNLCVYYNYVEVQKWKMKRYFLVIDIVKDLVQSPNSSGSNYTTIYLTYVVRAWVAKIFSDLDKNLPLGVVFGVTRESDIIWFI